MSKEHMSKNLPPIYDIINSALQNYAYDNNFTKPILHDIDEIVWNPISCKPVAIIDYHLNNSENFIVDHTLVLREKQPVLNGYRYVARKLKIKCYLVIHSKDGKYFHIVNLLSDKCTKNLCSLEQYCKFICDLVNNG